ncbi:MAG: sugar phosphate isomerase/epimerase family protein [Candidatus Latescibacterota bacterium]|nr:sugar phosphate isomerase/epimerase family protein [Candidatus Latescibacterota bacterium]
MSNTLSYRCGSLENPSLPFERIAACGVQGLEVNWSEKLSAAAAEAALSPHGLRVTSLSTGCDITNGNLPAEIGERAALASDLGANYLFVSAQRGELDFDEAARRLQALGDAAGKSKVCLAMETHPDLCTNAETMLKTMAVVDHPWVAINYDTANVYYYNEGIDTIDQVRQVAKFVKGVHFKDTGGGFRDFDFPVFGEGIVDFAAVDEELTEAGYDDAYCMELEGPAFKRDEPNDLANKVTRCADHLRAVGAID